MRKFTKEYYEDKGEQPLGEGSEKKVFLSPHNPERVIGIFHEYREETPEQVKGRFYLTKILHALYPQHIPELHLAASNPHAVEVERINGEHTYSWEVISRLEETLREVGVIVDTYTGNFLIDSSGFLRYVDTVMPWYGVNRNYNPAKIKEVGSKKLEAKDLERVLSYLARLESLYQDSVRLQVKKHKTL